MQVFVLSFVFVLWLDKMKLFLLVGLLAVCVNSYPFPSSDTAKSDFVKWKQFFKKIYDTVEEEEHRFATWLKNMKKIVEHNLAYSMNKKSYRMEMNHFGDMNVTEYKRTMNGYRMDLREKVRFGKTFGSTFMMSLSNVTLPKNLDWVEKGLVTPVKNQGQCGSCWSFSATGSLEGQMMRKTGKLVSLSEQNLIDCSVPEGNQGCNGGLMDQAFDYIKKNKGIDTEESYPYEGIDDKCRFSATNIGGDDVGYKDIPTGNEHALREAVATQGPVSVAIDASQESFQFYSDGLYDEPKCSSEQLDHGVLVVGYGLMHHTKEKYWLVKNSWGPEWGDKGYIRMSRMKDNQCGIATQASYPIV